MAVMDTLSMSYDAVKTVDTTTIKLKEITQTQIKGVFEPRGIAVVGATDRQGSVGRTVLKNLVFGYHFTRKPNPFEIFPVNPKRSEIMGMKCYPSVSTIDDTRCEQAIVITPASSCLEVVKDCVKNKSLKAIVILSAGFKEVGEAGLKLEREIVKVCVEAGVALIGPNCVGVMIPPHQMNGTFASASAMSGSIAYIVQSGAMCTTTLDWSRKIHVGFSAFVSIGSMAHIQWAPLLEYLGTDKHTDVVVCYMETIGNAGEFVKAARRVSKMKPVLIIKAGQTCPGARAAISHTGSVAGSQLCIEAAIARTGCVLLPSMQQMQYLSLMMSMQPLPTGDGLIVITNAGGPGVLATDAAIKAGLKVTDLSEEVVEQYSAFLPKAWSHHNPIDIIGDACPILYQKSVELAMRTVGKGNSILVVLAPQSMTNPEDTAEQIAETVHRLRGSVEFDGPVVCSFIGGYAVQPGNVKLLENGIPAFTYPDLAAETLALAWQSVYNVRNMGEIYEPSNIEDPVQSARLIIHSARQAGRTCLFDTESKNLLKLFNVDVADSEVCLTVEDALQASASSQHRCMLKHIDASVGVRVDGEDSLRSTFKEMVHAVELAGSSTFNGVVVLPLVDMRGAIELSLGSFTDQQVGPLVVFGPGGDILKIYQDDTAMACPPISKEQATDLVMKTKIGSAMANGVLSINEISSLSKIVSNFSVAISQLYDEIAECAINPLLALPNRVVAYNVRINLHPVNSIPTKPCLL